MKKTIGALLIGIVFGSCNHAPVPATQIPNDIKNTKTSKHLNIPGTKLFLIPPDGFKVATNFIGIQKDNYTALTVYDLTGGNFYSNAATFSKAAFESKGAKVFDYQEFKIDGFPAKYIYMQGDPSAREYSLVFGDSTFSSMIMATFPSNDTVEGEKIKASILSIVYDKNLKIDPFASASFILDDSNSKFKFAKTSASLFMYTIGGVDKPSYGDESFVTVNSIPADPGMTPSSMSDILIQSVQKYGFTDIEVKNKSLASVNGYDAFESEMYGTLNGQKQLMYQLLLLDGNRGLIIQGISKSNFDSDLDEFKKLSHTIKFK